MDVKQENVNKMMKIAISYFLTVTCLLMFIFLFPKNEGTNISCFKASSQDGFIVLSWNCIWKNLKAECMSRIRIEVIGDEGTAYYYLKPSKNEFVYSDGLNGNGYSFHMSIVDNNEAVLCETDTIRALFINYDSLPDLPLICITTDSGEEPDCDYLSAPNENCMGASIINNDFVYGNFKVWQNGAMSSGLRMKIKIRGNTSAYSDKKPYKIVFEEPVDLLQVSGKQADTDWILLKNNNLNMPIGTFVSELCGIEWQPHFRFVNVILNGDWKGCYLLTQSVGPGEDKVDLEGSGFIIENNAYWWNEEDNYFKSFAQRNFQQENGGFGYTFKYLPSGDKIETKKQIETFINEFEQVLYIRSENCQVALEKNYTDYIDESSFVSWILAHDLLGSLDFGGSNIFLYKENLIKDNETETKIKIGPLWDFDSNFMNEGQWSNIHITGMFYYPMLFEKESFVAKYVEKWNDISDTVCRETSEYLYELRNKYGDAIQNSWIMDEERWEYVSESIDGDISEAEIWFESRTMWMNGTVSALKEAS